MKKTVLFVLLLMSGILTLSLTAQETFSLSLHGHYLTSSGEDFKEIYGSGRLLPEVKVSVNIAGGVYVWGGYGWFKATGKTPILQEDAESKQSFLSLGAGYTFSISSRLSMKLSAAYCSINYKEDSMGVSIDETAGGFHIEDELLISLGKNLYVSLAVGYIRGTDTYETIDVTLGGLKAGAGIGVRF